MGKLVYSVLRTNSSILQHLVNSYMTRSHPASLFKLLVVIVLSITLTSCTTLADTQIQNFAPATETPAPPSPTIVWFPPTATATPQLFPTKAPTPEQKPGVGSIILRDDFSSPALWNTAVSDQASVGVSLNRLTIVVQPGIYAFSLRQNVAFGNFYAEVTARLSLCRGTDDYGLLFRAPNNVAYYSFVLSCNGTARVERVSRETPHVLQPPIASGDAPPGAPGEARLGVWAVGSDLRFFLNGRYQFSVNDKNYPAGAIGVFAHSTGNTPVTLTFSDLIVYDVTYSPPTSVPKP